MADATGKVQELTRLQDMRAPVDRDVDGALDALNRDLPRHAVWWQRPAGQENQAHDFQVGGLEQRDRLLLRQARAQRPHLYGLAWPGMQDCHGSEYALALDGNGRQAALAMWNC